ncbi:MFS transporter [Sphingomonas sp. MMSM24]|uniref:MFS transporter n=1 Tax=Sphingomonas lycopersici TaxID=2951807 RepID=A0AA41ZCK6_9SPHN|nr:MFS transporter [Sphingomonas lycopersici]
MERVERIAAAHPNEWRGGWRVIAAAMIGNGFGPGMYQNLSSLFVPGMTAAFGWTRGDIATAAGIGLIGALGVPAIGRLADRLGARPVIVGATLLLAATLAGFATLGGALWIYQLLVLCLALSVAGTSAVVYGRLIAARFVTHRGIALGVATSGLSLSTLVLSPLVAGVIARHGWRVGFAVLVALVLAVALPAVLLLLRGVVVAPVHRAGEAEDIAPETLLAGMSAREARRDARFWRLGLAVALVSLASVGLITQLAPFGTDRGLGLEQAALLVTAFGASQIVGRLAMGLLVDRFPARLIAAGFAAISAAAFAGLLLPGSGVAGLAALVFAALLMNGAENDLLPFLTARLFGLRAYGETYGALLTMSLFGTASGIVMFGRLYDATGNYAWPLSIAAGALALAALLFLTLTERREGEAL